VTIALDFETMAEEIQQIVLTPIQGQTCWLALRPSGLCRSDDAGASWQTLLSNEQLASKLARLIVSPDFAHDQRLIVGGQPGIWWSQDGGRSWQPSEIELPLPSITDFAISPDFKRDQTAFAASTADGVLVSYTGGRRWARWNIGLFDHRVLSLAISPNFAHDRTLYAGTSSGLFRSNNSGRSWQEVTTPLGETAITAVQVEKHYEATALVIGGTRAGPIFIAR